MMGDEIDLGKDNNDEIATLKADIRRLEKNNERVQNMFFKHNQIFEHKLERETKAKKELEEKVKSLQRDREQDEDEMNAEILSLSQELSQQKEANVVLQDHFEMISDQNIRLKKIEEDYNLVAKHIDADYSEMNRLMEELRVKSKQKEQELEAIKSEITAKEMENNKLQKHMVQSSQTIEELQAQLQLDTAKEFEAEKLSYRQDLGAGTSKLASLRSEMNMLIKEKDDLLIKTKKELDAQKRLVEETKISKVQLVSNFATEMNRIRGEIKKQNKSRNSIVRS